MTLFQRGLLLTSMTVAVLTTVGDVDLAPALIAALIVLTVMEFGVGIVRITEETHNKITGVARRTTCLVITIGFLVARPLVM